jgi:lysine 6-dehydrogenase
MKILVLGAGRMGSAIAYDIGQFGREHQLGLADQNDDLLQVIASKLSEKPELHSVDCQDETAVAEIVKSYDIAVSALPFGMNERLTNVAIETKTHFLDLGGNSEIVRQQLSYGKKARSAGVTIVPNCGLAPGMSNIFAMTGFNLFEEVDSIKARVGGLPQHPRPPLMYQLLFSVEGLINEYVENAEIIDHGTRRFVPSLTGLESLSFGDEYGELEAFYTSGGLSLLPEILDGKVQHLSYKTVRYRGHCEKFRTLLDLGFAGSEPVMIGGGVHTSRELFAELLRKKLAGSDQDLVLFRIDIEGKRKGRGVLLRYEMTDRYDQDTRITAMMRTTAYPTSAIALMLASGEISERGVFLPEQIIQGDRLIDDLKKRNIKISKSLKELL